jgi:hypothetical protein
MNAKLSPLFDEVMAGVYFAKATKAGQNGAILLPADAAKNGQTGPYMFLPNEPTDFGEGISWNILM